MKKGILIIPDVHGRDFWKEAIERKDYEKVVFLGDYSDPYDIEGITDDVAIDNFKSIIDYKKNKKAIKYTSKKEQLYSIINNTQKYHKIITDDKYIDLIFISSFGIMTINVLSIDGEIKLLDNNKLYYKEKGGKEGTIVNFLDKINEEVEHIKKVTNTNEIKKYLIVGKGKVSNDNFATGFNVKYISEIYYEIEKIKDNTYSNEDIDRMYELIDSGCNKN